MYALLNLTLSSSCCLLFRIVSTLYVMLNHPDRRRTLNFYHLEDRIIVVHIYNYISANDGKKASM